MEYFRELKKQIKTIKFDKLIKNLRIKENLRSENYKMLGKTYKTLCIGMGIVLPFMYAVANSDGSFLIDDE